MFQDGVRVNIRQTGQQTGPRNGWDQLQHLGWILAAWYYIELLRFVPDLRLLLRLCYWLCYYSGQGDINSLTLNCTHFSCTLHWIHPAYFSTDQVGLPEFLAYLHQTFDNHHSKDPIYFFVRLSYQLGFIQVQYRFTSIFIFILELPIFQTPITSSIAKY